jgi:hypothetical protein
MAPGNVRRRWCQQSTALADPPALPDAEPLASDATPLADPEPLADAEPLASDATPLADPEPLADADPLALPDADADPLASDATPLADPEPLADAEPLASDGHSLPSVAPRSRTEAPSSASPHAAMRISSVHARRTCSRGMRVTECSLS